MKDVYYQKLTKHIFNIRKKQSTNKKAAITKLVSTGMITGLKLAREEYRLMKRSK